MTVAVESGPKLLLQPQDISVTFYRSSGTSGGSGGGGELPVTFQVSPNGCVYVTEIFWLHSPITIGDELIEVLSSGCGGGNSNSRRTKTAATVVFHPRQIVDCIKVQQQLNGVVTMRFRKMAPPPPPPTAAAAAATDTTTTPSIKEQVQFCNALRGSFFVQPQAHTCLPMALNFCRHYQHGRLSLAPSPVIDRNDDDNDDGSNNQDWLAHSYLEPGHIVVSMNGSSSHQLEEEDAQRFLQTKLTMDPYLYIVSQQQPWYGESNDNTSAAAAAAAAAPPPKEITIPSDPVVRRFLAHEYDTFQRFIQDTMLNDQHTLIPATERVGSDCCAYVSSKNMFLTIQQSLQRLERLSSCSPDAVALILMQVVLPKALKEYADYMKQRLPNTKTTKTMTMSFANATPISSSASSSSRTNGLLTRLQRNGKSSNTYNRYVETTEDIGQVCHVIGTCDYCTSQVQALEETLMESYPLNTTTNHNNNHNKPVLSESVVEAFQDVIAKAMSVLVSGLIQQLQPCLEKMGPQVFAKAKPAAVARKGILLRRNNNNDNKDDSTISDNYEESPYVQEICDIMDTYTTTIAAANLVLPRCYVRSFCDKFVLAFCAVYYDTCQPIVTKKQNKTVSHHLLQQLLLDVYHLKEQSLRLPSDASSFPGLVKSQYRNIEVLLKGKLMKLHDGTDVRSIATVQ